jgi:hypothetical protein
MKCPLCKLRVTRGDFVRIEVLLVSNGKKSGSMPGIIAECCATLYLDVSSKKISEREGSETILRKFTSRTKK